VEFRAHFSPPFHLTTSKVMLIVWRLRGNIIITVLYIANVLPLQWAQLTKTVHTARLGLEFVFLCFLGYMICLYVHVCFVLPSSVESHTFCFGAGVTNLNEPPSSFLLPPYSFIPCRAIVNKQCEMRGLFMSLVSGHPLLNRRCTRFPWCICLRNDLYWVGWGVKLYSLTTRAHFCNVVF